MRPARTFRCRAVLVTLLALGGCGPAARVGAPPTPAEIPALEARLVRNPGDVGLLTRLGAAYLQAGQAEEARVVLERAVARAGRASDAAVLLGVAYESLGRYADARGAYAGYAEAGPSRPLREEARRRIALLTRLELQDAVRAALAREAELAAAAPEPRTVAVLPFRFVGQDARFRPLSRALAELLVADLSQTGRLRVLERTRVQLLANEIGLDEARLADAETAARAGRLLGAARVVQGSVGGDADELRVEAAVVPVGAAAEPEAEVRAAPLVEADDAARFFALEKNLALRLHDALGIELTPAERERVSRRHTENIQALLAFGQGLEAEDAGDDDAAARHYRRAAVLDPSFALAREHAEAAELRLAAVGVPAGELTRLALRGPGDTDALDAALNAFLPGAVIRDAAAEALGNEGLGRKAILDLIFRRP